MKVLGIIPARGGSKGVPRKNIRLLNGKPLLAYTAESALQAKKLSRIILTTEDEEIAGVGRRYGLEVPFMRPPNLALDTTPTLPVIVHALETLEAAGETYDAICLLQPTNPLRRAEDIDNCIRLLETSAADSVVSVLAVPDEYNPKWVFWMREDGKLNLCSGENEPIARRQDLPLAFHRDGTIYLIRKSVLLEHGNLYGKNIQAYQMNPKYSVNIDTMQDWNETKMRIAETADLKSLNQPQ